MKNITKAIDCGAIFSIGRDSGRFENCYRANIRFGHGLKSREIETCAASTVDEAIYILENSPLLRSELDAIEAERKKVLPLPL